MTQKRPSFWYVLNILKSVGKTYHLEIIQLCEGILTHRYKRKSSKRIDCYISEAERKLEEKRYTSMEYSKVVAHVTVQSFDKNKSDEKEINNSENEETYLSRDEFILGHNCEETELTDFTFLR